MAAAQKRSQQTKLTSISCLQDAMSLYSIPKKKHTAFYDVLTPRDPDAKTRKASKISVEVPRKNLKSDDTRSLDKTKELNTTCVISGLSKSRGQKNDTPVLGRLALQRSKTGANGDKTRSENTMDMTPNSTPASEKTLSLQRRTRTGSIDKSAGNDMGKAEGSRQRWVSGTDSNQSKGLSESNPRTTGNAGVLRSFSLRDTSSKSQSREAVNLLNTPTKGVERFPSRFTPKQPATPGKVDVTKPEDQTKTFSTPTRKTPFEKITAKKDAFERLAGKKGQKVGAVKTTSLERLKKHAQVTVEAAKPGAIHRSKKFPLSSQGANVASTFPPAQVRKNSIHSDVNVARSSTPVPTSYVSTEPLVRSKPDTLKMENSAVTVAVRVRPFNTREKTEKASQVIFMDNQETVVQHPDTKQRHAFTYDFSFCSVDKSDPGFASQQTVYEKLAKPLLERAFEGFNTCLFAYGQTGSGKSYTMMGFGEEAGLTPRFCQELFSRLSVDNQVTCHLGMSYFEVYNEKIHDLLVVRDEQNHKRLPLRVREHPVDGPYVAELSTNVVSSYEDIQGWLELGNKQRATAATGMNDKSSRSHSVFTLVMTQTKTEFVEGEEHDHRITSRINLVDLAGSERCSSAQTSGDRLMEGASINKSLLSLGKVISALSEQAQTRRKVFTPYREAVLTWLLKESLGGNSKTAMIATLSPAGSNVEESLSTLRYAKQARMIINVAKVNEDTNAKLIRELKAEVEKLRAAQMSSQGIEPEKMHLFQQEILALKSQLTQQEREMAEAHRAWREKLEQAEKHKREETEELQKAGVTFTVDNRLPNLVNLNEDPQLSEMLLYMIKEGQTEVGQHKSESPHDIQLSGALIADRHCVISNVNGEVSITPVENAKTFVNGNLVSDITVLCHGDRVILGGDHYFRFNHPAEVQSGKRVSCWTGAGDGQKDFEFAKNELLSAQRAQLEEEIEEARLKAKEEMMQGILGAKEMAQEELSDQKARYENRIKALERELEEESERKRHWEMDQQKVASKMEELQSAKVELEQEVDTHKTRLRLHMEAQATRRAMDDHGVRQAKVVEALEAEKRKIGKDLEEMQRKLALKGSRTPKNVPPRWDAMKLSLMIEEANKISDKLKKNTVFSRHEGSEKKCGEGELQVQVKNTKLGISTFWSLEKFQSNLAAIRELDQGDRSASKDDDLFYDPNDEWEQDMSASSTAASFSRRRSRSLLKSRRISGRLYEIRVHPIQSLHNSNLPQSSGLLGVAKPPSLHPSSSDSVLPGICKDLIGQTVGQLRECHSHEESMADRLTSDLCCVHTAVTTISDLYDGLDDDSQENMFVFEAEAQSQLVKATSAIQRAVFITMQWVTSVDPRTATLYINAEELKTQVKRMGGYFQLLIQGCDSEISSMVNEAHRKSGQCLDSALQVISHLAALTGTQLHVTELWAEATGKRSVVLSLLEGTCKGVHSLLEEGLTISKEMLSDAQLTYPRTPVLQSLKSKTLDLSCALQSYIHCHMTERDEGSERSGEDLDPSHLHRVKNTAAKLFQLNQAIRQLHSALSLALRGTHTVWPSGSSTLLSLSSSEVLTQSGHRAAPLCSLSRPPRYSHSLAIGQLHSALSLALRGTHTVWPSGSSTLLSLSPSEVLTQSGHRAAPLCSLSRPPRYSHSLAIGQLHSALSLALRGTHTVWPSGSSTLLSLSPSEVLTQSGHRAAPLCSLSRPPRYSHSLAIGQLHSALSLALRGTHTVWPSGSSTLLSLSPSEVLTQSGHRAAPLCSLSLPPRYSHSLAIGQLHSALSLSLRGTHTVWPSGSSTLLSLSLRGTHTVWPSGSSTLLSLSPSEVLTQSGHRAAPLCSLSRPPRYSHSLAIGQLHSALSLALRGTHTVWPSGSSTLLSLSPSEVLTQSGHRAAPLCSLSLPPRYSHSLAIGQLHSALSLSLRGTHTVWPSGSSTLLSLSPSEVLTQSGHRAAPLCSLSRPPRYSHSLAIGQLHSALSLALRGTHTVWPSGSSTLLSLSPSEVLTQSGHRAAPLCSLSRPPRYSHSLAIGQLHSALSLALRGTHTVWPSGSSTLLSLSLVLIRVCEPVELLEISLQSFPNRSSLKRKKKNFHSKFAPFIKITI
eukprot:XP_014005302.1 PREDICTED: kinesin-like protein KIF14 isoform X1 [Salmo salar]